MKRVSLFEGIGVAVILCITALIISLVSAVFFPFYLVIRIVTTLISVLYAYYLLSRSASTVGRVTLGALAIVALGTAFFSPLSNLAVVLTGLGIVWLIRSMLFHQRPIAALLDAILTVTALGVATCVATVGAGFIVALWCLLLVQALFVFIPLSEKDRESVEKSTPGMDTFTTAFQAADAALEMMVKRT